MYAIEDKIKDIVDKEISLLIDVVPDKFKGRLRNIKIEVVTKPITFYAASFPDRNLIEISVEDDCNNRQIRRPSLL